MKSLKFLLILFMTGVFGQAFGQTVLFDYDGTNMDFSSWGSVTWSKVANPDASGINTSANVGEFGYDNNWIGVHGDAALTPAIDFTATPFFRMKVYSASAIKVTLKFENFIDYGINAEQTVQLAPDQVNKWVEVAFNFTGTTLTNLDRVTLFFDGPKDFSTAGTKYYFDDLIGSNVAPAAQLIYAPAEAATNQQLFSSCAISSNYGFINADGSAITDPTSSLLLKVGGSTGTDVPFTASISADKKTMTITPSALLDAASTYWYGVKENTLKFSVIETSVAGVSASFSTRATVPTMITYANYDGVDNTTLQESLGGPAGAFSTNFIDPVNTSNTAAQWARGTSWWGWERIHIDLKEAIDVSKDRIFSLRVYSPKVSFVRFKVSNQSADGGLFKETDAQITKANEWQTLYFSFPAFDVADYKHLFIFIDGGNTTDANTFLVDDIKGPDFASSTSLFGGAKTSQLTVGPNPTSDILNISNVMDGDVVEVVNIAGEVVAKLPVNGEQVSLGALQSGVYIVRVNGFSAKVVKN